VATPLLMSAAEEAMPLPTRAASQAVQPTWAVSPAVV
jgi:hypothetical protein